MRRRRVIWVMLACLLVPVALYALMPIAAAAGLTYLLHRQGYQHITVQLGYPGWHTLQIPVLSFQKDLDGEALSVTVQDSRLQYDIGSLFSGRAQGPTPPPVRPPEPPQLGEHRAEIPRPTALAALAMAYHIPAFDHADALPLEVLGQILSQGQSSRLYRDLVYERQLATSVSANADLRIDPGLFTIVSMVQSGKTPSEVEAAIYEQLEQVTAESIADRELEKAINQALSGFVFRQDSIQQQGFTIGSFHILQSYKVINEYIERLRRVTKQDVARAARTYLTKTNRTVVTIVPMSPPKAG